MVDPENCKTGGGGGGQMPYRGTVRISTLARGSGGMFLPGNHCCQSI